MKKITTLFVGLIIIGLTISSFHAQAEFLPTKLRITVVDELGNIVEGATITLYKNEADYRSNKNPVQSLTTDKKGRATFTDLEPVSYFIDARKGDKNNDGKGAVTAPLLEGKINKLNTVIE